MSLFEIDGSYTDTHAGWQEAARAAEEASTDDERDLLAHAKAGRIVLGLSMQHGSRVTIDGENGGDR